MLLSVYAQPVRFIHGGRAYKNLLPAGLAPLPCPPTSTRVGGLLSWGMELLKFWKDGA